MAIHFYYGGTDGKQDGTLISNGDLTSPLIADGFYPASGVMLSKTIPVQIRADAGEVWKFVSVAFVSDTEDLSNKEYSVATGDLYEPVSSYYCIKYDVTDTNKTFHVNISANGSETNTPDTSVKLVVTGGVKVG